MKIGDIKIYDKFVCRQYIKKHAKGVAWTHTGSLNILAVKRLGRIKFHYVNNATKDSFMNTHIITTVNITQSFLGALKISFVLSPLLIVPLLIITTLSMAVNIVITARWKVILHARVLQHVTTSDLKTAICLFSHINIWCRDVTHDTRHTRTPIKNILLHIHSTSPTWNLIRQVCSNFNPPINTWSMLKHLFRLNWHCNSVFPSSHQKW